MGKSQGRNGSLLLGGSSQLVSSWHTACRRPCVKLPILGFGGWGGVGNDVNVPWTYPHGWCYATWWGGVGWGMMLTFLELTHMVDASNMPPLPAAVPLRTNLNWQEHSALTGLGSPWKRSGCHRKFIALIKWMDIGNWAASRYNKCGVKTPQDFLKELQKILKIWVKMPKRK